jgi:16S rRNA (guanine527-N7)-methyltransferase
MVTDAAVVRVHELGERYRLSARQRRRLAALLTVLASDPHAPTSVRRRDRAVDAHIADSLVALELQPLRDAELIVDLGSGAGFPGLPLAIALEASTVWLLESQLRKCLYLERAIAEVGLANAGVVCARAEQWCAGQGTGDAVVARAVGAQPVVVEYAAPLLRVGGVLVDWRGSRALEEELRAARAAEQLGMRLTEIRRIAPFAGARDRHLHLYLKITETPSGYPRRVGAAGKRPLGA